MQRWVGDLVDVGPGNFVGNRVHVPMSTAIVRTYTREGFIIAADGLVRGSDDLKEVTDKAQKVFPFGGIGALLAYSIAGTPCIASRDGTKVAFDFVKRIETATQALSVQRFNTLFDYANRACRPIYRALEAAKREGLMDYPEPEKLDPGDRGSTIASIFIDGYHKGIPSRVKVRFFHEDQTLAPLEVLPQELATGAPWFHGSAKASTLMFGERQGASKEWLSAYEMESIKLIFHPNETLCIHAQMAHAYIRVCSAAPEVIAMDPKEREICAGIGGEIQIAAITENEGFQWIFRPEKFEPVCEALSRSES